jgi:RNA polymerase sigma-70 factor (ECF subfamily)
MVDPDGAIVSAVRAGDTDAFRELVERHKGRVFGVLMTLVADEAVAEELAQDAFVKAFTGLAGFQGEATFGTWLVQIAIHGARDHRRRAQRLRQRRVVSLEALREARREAADPADTKRTNDPGTHLESEEAHDRIQFALAKLPADYREVIVLKHLEGWSYETIAELTGDSVGTLKVRAHRARRMMKDALEAQAAGAPDEPMERENG